MDAVRAAIDDVYREESGRVLSGLIRYLGDFDLAEDALMEAFATAVERWAADGLPRNPAAWLTTAARRKALDRIRRRTVRSDKAPDLRLLARLERDAQTEPDLDVIVPDERLALIFTCCHPALAVEARIALTLRTLGGLTTPEIAKAFLVGESTLAQRLVRAKKKIKAAGIPYRVPPPDLLPERVPSVLRVLYLIFNEGYAASAGDALVRRELCAEAIRLASILAELMPHDAEVLGLRALMLLQDSRRDARADADGNLVLLEDQDRTTWDREQIRVGAAVVQQALRLGQVGPYVVQAAIAAVHGDAATPADTDWHRIASLYSTLVAVQPSPVIELNRAVAVAMADGAEAGLALLDDGALATALDRYHLFHAARADLLRRTGRLSAAAAAYRRALDLTGNAAERRFLEGRLAEVTG